MKKSNILTIKNLEVDFVKKNEPNQEIIRGIDLEIPRGEIVGVVGESGSGKSISMKAIMNLLPDNAKLKYDEFIFDDISLNNKEKNKLPISMIFQDPMTALNPLRTIGYHLIEVVQRQKKTSKKEAEKIAVAKLNEVGILLPEKRMTQYPHELSGGMRQRIMIAMALLSKPLLLIADEPTTALDVTVQAQILHLIRDLQKEEKLSVILVTHDFGIVAGMCQSIIVMYDGEIVEEGKTDEIFYNAQHWYTKELLKAIPNGNKDERLYSLNSKLDGGSIKNRGSMKKISDTHRVLRKG